MATIDYVDIPAAATRLQSRERSDDVRPATKVRTGLPQPQGTPSPGLLPMSPTKPNFNFAQVLLSSALPLPANAPSTPRATRDTPKLLSTRDPLSIPITTVNFRKFVSNAGPVFWLQDRVEEVVMWRKGWLHTSVWMAAYAFLCYFPRLALLLPNIVLLGILLVKNPAIYKDQPPASETARVLRASAPSTPAVSEFSTEWLANVQAIQNLMGAFSEVQEAVAPAVPHLNYSSPYTPLILTVVAVSSILLIPLVQFVPLRTTFLILGLAPFVLTHPFTRFTLLPLTAQLVGSHVKRARVRFARVVDNDCLEDKHWRSELQEVYLWENERWAGISGNEDAGFVEANWSKGNLRPGERRGWTRGRDGWSAVSDDGSGDVSSNLTFALAPGWLFVETEDWRPDLEGLWIQPIGTDDNGWVYTNDTWMDPQPVPLEEGKAANGLTRRRRWIRRIYYDPTYAT